MKFTKMHGLGNDYVFVNLMEEETFSFAALSPLISNRHMGIGSDGIITIDKSEDADFSMQIYNADGSVGEMCGNGIRCVGKYVYENGLTKKEHLSIATLAGIKFLDLNIVNGKVDTVKVDLGIPSLHDGSLLMKESCMHSLDVSGTTFDVMDVSMGNPHTVIFVPHITDELVLYYGPQIEMHSFYPNRTNVEFVRIMDRNNIEMRVYERGSGETMACGTGACAAAIASMLKGICDKEIFVHLLGGTLHVLWEKDGHVYMEGPAIKVFEGEIDLKAIIK